jgi:ssDNA-binding Zn-finger/Zn-ribbon topoisomerase 1
MSLFTLLQRFGNEAGSVPISPSEARVITVFFIAAVLIILMLWKLDSVFGTVRDWYRSITKVPFEKMSKRQRDRILANAYCLKCGQLDRLISPVEEMRQGEHVITSDCPKCKGKVYVRL